MALLDLAAGPTSAPPSSAASRRCRSTRASSRRASSARRSRRSTRTGGRSSARSASSCSPSRCRRCRSASGATTTDRASRELLLRLPGGLAPRRLDRDHLPRHRDHHGRSDATINRGGVRIGTSELYRASSELEPSWTRSSSTAADGDGRPDDAVRGRSARARSSTSRLAAEIRAPDPRRLLAAPRPRRDRRALAAVPRTLSGKVVEVPVKRILMGAAARRGREPRLARESRGARLVRASSAGVANFPFTRPVRTYEEQGCPSWPQIVLVRASPFPFSSTVSYRSWNSTASATHLRVCPECEASAEQVRDVTLRLREATLEVPAERMMLPRRGRRWAVGSAVALASAAAVVATMFFTPGGHRASALHASRLNRRTLSAERIVAPRLTRLEDGRFAALSSPADRRTASGPSDLALRAS